MPQAPKRWTQILTIWQERPALSDHPPVWRFSLEDVHAGERRGFADLEALTVFLRGRLADEDEPRLDDPA